MLNNGYCAAYFLFFLTSFRTEFNRSGLQIILVIKRGLNQG